MGGPRERGGVFAGIDDAMARVREVAGADVLVVSSGGPISTVVGHEHVAPGRKQDPGPGFDWARLHALTGWDRQRFAG